MTGFLALANMNSRPGGDGNAGRYFRIFHVLSRNVRGEGSRATGSVFFVDKNGFDSNFAAYK